MNESPKIYRILTTAGYYYATPNGRYGRFSKKVERAWLLCEHHAKENIPWMKDTGIEPRLILTDKMYCHQCDVNKRSRNVVPKQNT